MIELYHYTDSAGVEGIVDSGVILISDGGAGGDARYGQGVYLTQKGPSNFTKTQIARNNWDDGYKQAKKLIKRGRVDYAIKITIPKSEVEKAPINKRDVYVYPGDLSLDDYEWEVVEVN